MSGVTDVRRTGTVHTRERTSLCHSEHIPSFQCVSVALFLSRSPARSCLASFLCVSACLSLCSDSLSLSQSHTRIHTRNRQLSLFLSICRRCRRRRRRRRRRHSSASPSRSRGQKWREQTQPEDWRRSRHWRSWCTRSG